MKNSQDSFVKTYYRHIFSDSVHDAGHSVVGVEVAENAIQEFFSVNKLEYTVTKLDKIKGSLYKVGRKVFQIQVFCSKFTQKY